MLEDWNNSLDREPQMLEDWNNSFRWDREIKDSSGAKAVGAVAVYTVVEGRA